MIIHDQIQFLETFLVSWEMASHLDDDHKYLNQLTEMYQNWLGSEGLPLMSADELLCELQLVEAGEVSAHVPLAHASKKSISELSDEEVIKELVGRGYVRVLFTHEDIRLHALKRDIKLDAQQVKDVAGILESKADAESGLSWQVIDDTIDLYLQEED